VVANWLSVLFKLKTMKKTIIACSLILTAFFAVLSCNNNVPEGEETPTVAIASHRAPIDTVTKNIQHYVDSCYVLFNDSITIKGIEHPADSIIRAYTVSGNDLLSVLGLSATQRCTFDSCRVYIGLDYSSKFKLYLTPIKNGRDTILRDSKGNEYLLDLNAPCPSTCGGMDARLYPKARNL